MDPLRWNRVCELFAAARELDADKRVHFLDEQCRDDPSLPPEVLLLIEQDNKKGPLDSHPTISNFRIPAVVAGRFRIVRYISEGGMGTVYAAEDLQLHERVALKTIRADVASDARAIERFKREILLGKSISHPNVCRIHDLVVDHSETGTEVFFLSMQFLDGETLASRIKRGSLTQSEALPLIEDMADGLSAAHKAGVVHRDFKSGNVMLVERDGRMQAVITDFGLARDVRGDPSRTLTQFAGTLDYMAPEQIRGEDVTPATDIYAFGVVMYEMVTGQRPFTGDSVATQHLHTEPRPLRELAPQVDQNLAEAILICLRKLPGERFQSASEFSASLRSGARRKGFKISLHRRPTPKPVILILLLCSSLLIAGAGFRTVRENVTQRVHNAFTQLLLGPGSSASAKSIQSLAVLPLIDVSNHESQDYLADGLTEELISHLTEVSALRVISRNSVMKYKHSQQPIGAIARELRVDAIVEGTVFRSDNRIRVTVELTDSNGRQNLWSRSYERNLGDVMALQSDVAQAIVSEIQVRLTPQEQQQLNSRVAPLDANAYEIYLQGRYLLNRRTPSELSAAVERFKSAIARDKDFAKAYGALADAYTLLGTYRVLPPEKAFSLAQDAARKALTIDPSLGEAHASLAHARWIYLQWEGAEDEFQAAITLNPGYASAHHWYALYLASQGRSDEALHEIKLAAALDPNSPIIQSNVAWCAFLARHYDEAIQKAKIALEQNPAFPVSHEYLGQAYLEKQQYKEAISELALAVELAGNTPYYLAELANAYASAGLTDKARTILAELTSMSKGSNVSPADLALIHVGLGENATAIRLLRDAMRTHSSGVVNLKVHPRYDALRSDPSFKALLHDLGSSSPKLERVVT